MNTLDSLIPASRPTFYFIGVSTGQSSIMKVFPAWAEALGLGDVVIRGIDCKVHDDPQVYRRVVDFIKHDPLSLGGLVTTHKLDLFKAARDLFDEVDPHAAFLGEASCISKRGGKLCAHAKDPLTSGLSFEAFIPSGYWKSGAELCLLGAGGSSLALTLYLATLIAADKRPAVVHVTNRSQPRLDEMRHIHATLGACGIDFRYHLCPAAVDNDVVVATLPAGSVVVNATGLGKDAPGSPLTDAVRFPQKGIVWEFNYRGDLLFLDQALRQKESAGLTVEDGWVYFIHGWTRVIAEVFAIDIPVSGPAFDRLGAVAAAVSPNKRKV